MTLSPCRFGDSACRWLSLGLQVLASQRAGLSIPVRGGVPRRSFGPAGHTTNLESEE